MWCFVLVSVGAVSAQVPPAPVPPVPTPQPTPPSEQAPERKLGTAFLMVTLVNGAYELGNLIRGQDTAKITPKTWWTNMKRGWEWDLDDFAVNQIGHPYQGNNYFTTGRASGLNYWESAGLTAFGSATWEYFGETNQASLNDFLNTTLGGMALGEMFHRTAWLVRDTTQSGKSRTMREVGAMALDPMSGVMRMMSGDWSRVSYKPRDMVPSSVGGTMSVGTLWRGSNTTTIDSHTYAFFETDLLYGDLTSGSSHTPYDAFAVRLAFGGGSALSEARVRGRLFSTPMRGMLFTISQGYQFNSNPAYRFGAQSFDASLGVVKQLTSRTSIFAAGWGGATVLGAVDSVPLPAIDLLPTGEPESGEGQQGVSTGPRFYDYGPGGNVGAFLTFRQDKRDLVSFSYELHHLHVLDGVRANHVLQRARLDVTLPVKGRLGIGASGEYFDRRTYFQIDDRTEHFRFPQVRVFLTWTMS